MNIYSISEFRTQLDLLLKKSKDGYSSCYLDICKFLKSDFSIILQTPEFIKQVSRTNKFKKTKLKNTALNLSAANGYRLIYIVDTETQNIYLLYIYPKQGKLANLNIGNNFENYLLNQFYKTKSTNSFELFIVN